MAANLKLVLRQAKGEGADMVMLSDVIRNLSEFETSQLVIELLNLASDTYEDPICKKVPILGVIENCLKAGLNPNHKSARGSILDYYSSPNTIDVYKRIINEFGGVADEENQKLFFAKGHFADVNKTKVPAKLADVFHYLRDLETAESAGRAGVPVLKGWEKKYPIETVVMAGQIQDYINTMSKKTLG